MAEVIIPEGYGLAKLSWLMAGRANPVTTTWGYSAALTPPDECALAIYNYCINNGSFSDASFMATTYTFLGVEVQQRVDGDLVGAAEVGSVAGEFVVALPPINCTLLMSKRTAFVGRKFRGRSYLPNMWCAENLVDQMGNLSPEAVTTWQGIVDVFAEGPGMGEPGFLTATAPYAVVLHSDGTTPTRITSLTAQGQMATQRRRMR